MITLPLRFISLSRKFFSRNGRGIFLLPENKLFISGLNTITSHKSLLLTLPRELDSKRCLLPSPEIEPDSKRCLLPSPEIELDSKRCLLPSPAIEPDSKRCHLPSPAIRLASKRCLLPSPDIGHDSKRRYLPLNQTCINMQNFISTFKNHTGSGILSFALSLVTPYISQQTFRPSFQNISLNY